MSMDDDDLLNLSSCCSSFRLEEIKQEVLKLRESLAFRKEQWEKECSVYDTSSATRAGRRNQSNFFNQLQDVTLFPYSDKLYSFVCAYDGGIIRDGIIHSGAIFQYYDENDDGDDYHGALPITDEFLPCDDEAIIQYLIPKPPFHRHCSICGDGNDQRTDYRRMWYLQHPNNPDYSYIQKWTLDYDEPNLYKKIVTYMRDDSPKKKSKRMQYSGPLSNQDKYVLLQLIRHATSDIQRDFRLAAASILCMASLQCCSDDIDYLRQFIAVISTDDFPSLCYGECSASLSSPTLNHNCHDVYTLYLTSIEILITHGIDRFTSDHARVLSAWVLMELDQVSDSEIDALFFAADETPGSSSSSSRVLLLAMSAAVEEQQPQQQQQSSSLNTLVKRQRAILKQTLQSTKDTLPPKFKSMLVRTVIIGIGKHAALDRIRMTVAATTSSKYYHSWIQCIRSLLNIAENCLRRLPSQEISETLVSHLIRSFCEAFVPPNIHEPDDDDDFKEEAEGETAMITDSLQEKVTDQVHDVETTAASNNDVDHRSASTTATSTHPEQPILPILPWKYTILNPNRYSDTILHADDDSYDLKNRTRKKGIMTPSTVVQTIIRALFYRFHVDITVSKYGYGDWLSLCHLPVSPYDSLLFNTRCNVCTEASIADEDDVDVDGEPLVARYEFSLVNLSRAWKRPWNPQSHGSFQLMFRNAATMTAMCTNRLGMPYEITKHLLSFFHRDWWPDERKKCWCSVCQFKELITCLQSNVPVPVVGFDNCTKSATVVPVNLRTCKGCNVALYCCKEHKKHILQDGHSRVCGSPPFRIPGKDEERLCELVSRCYYEDDIKQSLLIEESKEAVNEAEVEEDDDDEDSMWESIDGDDEEEESEKNGTTSIIYNFFKKYYDARRIEEPAFARHFAEE